jgi:hypothetical protein
MNNKELVNWFNSVDCTKVPFKITNTQPINWVSKDFGKIREVGRDYPKWKMKTRY